LAEAGRGSREAPTPEARISISRGSASSESIANRRPRELNTMVEPSVAGSRRYPCAELKEVWARRSEPSSAIDHRFADARSVSAAPGPGVSEANSSRSPYQAIRSFEAR